MENVSTLMKIFQMFGFFILVQTTGLDKKKRLADASRLHNIPRNGGFL